MSSLNILHLEDDPLDAELVCETLAADDLHADITRVDTREGFAAALTRPVDLILADYAVPGFDGLEAQTMATRERPDVPFIFVSGTLGEELAVERIKAGARDYVLKQRLSRLPSSVRRALGEAKAHAERALAEEALLRLNAELEEHVRTRTADLVESHSALRRTEQELRGAQAFLEDLLAASPSMVFRLDPKTLRPTYMSPNIGWLLGYGADELAECAISWPDLLHEDDGVTLLKALEGAVQQQTLQLQQECRLRSKDGRYRWAYCLLRIEYGPDELPEAILGYALDVTERKAAEQALQHSEARLSAILETIAEGILIIAADGRMTFWNPAAERLLGLDGTAIAERRLVPADWTIHSPDGVLLPVEQWPVGRVFATGHAISPQEISLLRGDGVTVMLSVSAAPLHDARGTLVGVVASFRDITERFRAEQAVQAARCEAERANRAKSEFLSRMSHDLRTPLNSILGFAQLIEAGADEAQDAAEQILKAGSHLLDLINDVLDLARIEAGHLSLSSEPVLVQEAVERVLQLVRPLADQRGIRLLFGETAFRQCHLIADRQRLNQVLLNLLGNAIKYNCAGGTVDVDCQQPRPGWLRIRVIDTGAGMPEAKLALLFRPFERLGAEQTGVEGSGLGLALSKGLVERMGGTMGVESVVDRGSVFWIELAMTDAPAVRQPAPEAERSLTLVDSAIQGKVLYIEDNAANIRLVERVFGRRPGVQLLTENEGGAGIARARREAPDLVLIDLHLPDMSGEDVLRHLWEDPATRMIPIAVLSADATPFQVKRLLAAGATAYLTKPLDLGALLRLVDERLTHRTGGAPMTAQDRAAGTGKTR